MTLTSSFAFLNFPIKLQEHKALNNQVWFQYFELSRITSPYCQTTIGYHKILLKRCKSGHLSKTCCLRLGFLSRIKPGKELVMNSLFGEMASREQAWGFKVREGKLCQSRVSRNIAHQSIKRVVLTNWLMQFGGWGKSENHRAGQHPRKLLGRS